MRHARSGWKGRPWLENFLPLMAGCCCLLILLPLSPIYFTMVWLCRPKRLKPPNPQNHVWRAEKVGAWLQTEEGQK